MFLVKMCLPWQRLVVPRLYHLYAQLHINIIHPCKFKEISLKSKWGVIRTRIFQCFSKMWLPWQRLVVPKLYHIYAHLHINIIHPCKFEEISLKSKWVIRTRIFQCFSKMWLPWQCLVVPKLYHLYKMHIYTSISSIHASLKKFH